MWVGPTDMDMWVPMELSLARERAETAPVTLITLFLSISICLSLNFFLYKIFFWYVCTPLKHPVMSNVKSFDFDLHISCSLFSSMLSLICVSYSARLGWEFSSVCVFCIFFFFWQPHMTNSTVNSAQIYCLRTHIFHFSATFLLKTGPTILFTHLKIILLQCFQFQ